MTQTDFNVAMLRSLKADRDAAYALYEENGSANVADLHNFEVADYAYAIGLKALAIQTIDALQDEIGNLKAVTR